jgi:hypothetical protein
VPDGAPTFGSGEGPVWVTGRGYSTSLDLARPTSAPSFYPTTSMFRSGEGPVWVTGRGYSTSFVLARMHVVQLTVLS